MTDSIDIENLRSPDAAVCFAAMRKIARDRSDPGEPATTLLVERLESPLKNLRLEAVAALRYTRSPKVVAALSRVVEEDDDSIVKGCAAYALGVVGLPLQFDVIVSGLTDASALVRLAMCRTLCSIPDQAARELLLDRLTDSSSDVRMLACRALIGMRISDPRILKTLQSLKSIERDHTKDEWLIERLRSDPDISKRWPGVDFGKPPWISIDDLADAARELAGKCEQEHSR